MSDNSKSRPLSPQAAAHWQRLKDMPADHFQLIIIGGGITGAGIFREATRAGLRALLVEKNDYAWGTSSRSSKLVHGGMRYLKQGNFKLTRESVLERERLLAESQNLVLPLPFMVPTYDGQKPGPLTFKAGVTIYNMIAGHWDRISHSVEETRLMAPHLVEKDLTGGLRYLDARGDDARMVLRLIFEGCQAGGVAINRTQAEKPEKTDLGWCVTLTSQTGESLTLKAPVIANATGIWVNRQRPGKGANLRPLRGTHLVFPYWRLPSPQALAIVHPRDNRPVYVLPWEGATLFGTTDMDHGDEIDREPRASAEEVAYLMEVLQARFPKLNLDFDDIISTFAGVRPVISTGKVDPSKESRDHKIWDDDGLLSITGGKLTTFRVMAIQLLEKAKPYLPDFKIARKLPAYDDGRPQWPDGFLSENVLTRLRSRFGPLAGKVAAEANAYELSFIPGTETLWAEIRWAVRHEQVNQLDDLMLRRVRLGQILPHGGRDILERVLSICSEELAWDEERGNAEKEAYFELIEKYYSVPKVLTSQV